MIGGDQSSVASFEYQTLLGPIRNRYLKWVEKMSSGNSKNSAKRIGLQH